MAISSSRPALLPWPPLLTLPSLTQLVCTCAVSHQAQSGSPAPQHRGKDMSFDDLAVGTSLEAFMKMAAEGSDEEDVEDVEDGKAHAEFEDDAGTGEKYVPFGSLYGASNAAVSAVLEAAEKAAAAGEGDLSPVASPEVSGGACSTPSIPYSPAQKSNTTR